MRYARYESSLGLCYSPVIKSISAGGFFGSHSCRHTSSKRTRPVGDSAPGGGGCLEQIPGARAAPSAAPGSPAPRGRCSGADNADNEGTRSPSFTACSNSRQVGPVKPKPPPFGDKHHRAGTAAFRLRLKKHQSRPPGWCDTKKGKNPNHSAMPHSDLLCSSNKLVQ